MRIKYREDKHSAFCKVKATHTIGLASPPFVNGASSAFVNCSFSFCLSI